MKNITKLSLLAITGLTALISIPLLSETTTTEKIQNQADETGKDIKKGARKVKKKVRDATGNESLTEDIKDAGKNAGDEIETKAKKIKRKID